MNDNLSQLSKNDITGIASLQYFEVLGSTQSYASANLAQLTLPALIVAGSQNAGFGQKQRPWESPSGNLYFTLVLKPDHIKTAQIPLINVACGLGLQKALAETCGLSCMIKWPNDLYHQGKKLCGLLSEYKNDTLLVGVGLNVNAEMSDYSPALQNTCTSLKIIKGVEQNRRQLLGKLVTKMLEHIHQLSLQGAAALITDFETHSGFVGSQVSFTQDETKLNGRVIGLSELGYLQVADNDNRVYELISGDVTLCY